jgi:hypothetical protein
MNPATLQTDVIVTHIWTIKRHVVGYHHHKPIAMYKVTLVNRECESATVEVSADDLLSYERFWKAAAEHRVWVLPNFYRTWLTHVVAAFKRTKRIHGSGT